MPQNLFDLEARRAALLQQISQLGDFRPGSITATTGRCGNPHCHCHRPNHPGHGPNFRLTSKIGGKTVTETFPNEAARRQAQREIDSYRQWQELSRELVQVSSAICRVRPIAEVAASGPEKKRWKRSSKKSAGRSVRS